MGYTGPTTDTTLNHPGVGDGKITPHDDYVLDDIVLKTKINQTGSGSARGQVNGGGLWVVTIR